MSKKKPTGTSLDSLMDMLADKDGMVRQGARESLVALGRPAVSSLIRALRHSESDQVRWEAAKALGAINDARSIPTLVEALSDSNSDVAWLAAEALIKFKKAAWLALFEMLIKSGSDSPILRQGAHHVLWKQKADGFNDLLKTLIEALDSSTDPESATVAAYEILKRMRTTS